MRTVPPNEQLRRWRRERGWTLKQMAGHLGKGWYLQHVHLVEKGEQTPGLQRAAEIEDLTGIPMRAWLTTKVA